MKSKKQLPPLFVGIAAALLGAGLLAAVLLPGFTSGGAVPPSLTPAIVRLSSATASASKPKPTQKPTPTPTPMPTPTPTPTPAVQRGALEGLIIGVDPGHQQHGNAKQEPIRPGSKKTKKKVSSGTCGRFSGVPEYVVNLQVGLLLQDLLEEAGAQVVMTRTVNEINITNIQRAQLFNEHQVDLAVRLHCNGSNDKRVRGAFMLVNSNKKFAYYHESIRAAECILRCYGEETGISVKKGITYRGDQTGFNWCERPITNIEMGHMTCKEEDFLLTDPVFQEKMAKGIFNGIVAYFSEKDTAPAAE